MISNRGDESAGPGATHLNLRIAAPDGIALATDVYLPESQHLPAPTVITRTPYGKIAHLQEGMGWAHHGFAYRQHGSRSPATHPKPTGSQGCSS
jgi:predicted acyl esterase